MLFCLAENVDTDRRDRWYGSQCRLHDVIDPGAGDRVNDYPTWYQMKSIPPVLTEKVKLSEPEKGRIRKCYRIEADSPDSDYHVHCTVQVATPTVNMILQHGFAA